MSDGEFVEFSVREVVGSFFFGGGSGGKKGGLSRGPTGERMVREFEGGGWKGGNVLPTGRVLRGLIEMTSEVLVGLVCGVLSGEERNGDFIETRRVACFDEGSNT